MISSRKEIRGADIASHYDELDRFYRDIWGEHVHHGLAVVRRNFDSSVRPAGGCTTDQ